MRIHHLDCCTMCPVGGRALWGSAGHMVGHVLLLETERDGLVLVETGVGLEDVRHRRQRMGMLGVAGGFPTREEGTAVRQVEALGFSASDVRHILVTHMDPDHAGGIGDFPEATVHLLEAERDAAMNPTPSERQRYKRFHVQAVKRWQTYPMDGEAWRGFPVAQRMIGFADDIVLVPFVGHSRGHAIIGVRGPEGWRLHAGDSYFHRGSITDGRVPLGQRTFERLVAGDWPRVKQNHGRLGELAADPEFTLFCAHDAQELAAAQARFALTSP